MYDSSISKEVLKSFSYDKLLDFTIGVLQRNASLENIIATQKELVRLANAEPYIPQSEMLPNLFCEAEIVAMYNESLKALLSSSEEKEEEKSETEAEKKERKPRIAQLTVPANTPVEIKDHTEGVPETYEEDGIKYKRGKDKVIYKLAITKPKKVVEKHIYATWDAVVEVEGREKKRIINFDNEIVDKLSCSPSLVASILTSKFDDHLPFYRQSEMYEREGLHIKRQHLCLWFLKYYDTLSGFDRYFGDQIFKMNLINQDETPLEVIAVKTESGKISSSSFAIIRIGTTYDEVNHKYKKVVHVYYSDGRSREKLFDGYERNNYSGPLMTDGLKGYLSNSINQEKHSVCWVHAIRKLKKYVRLVKDDEPINRILILHASLYKIESNLREKLIKGTITTEEFLSKREKDVRPILDQIFREAKAATISDSKTLRQEALNYLIEYEPYLYTYLKTLECTPDDNCCELVAKAFATGRKNWLFAQTIDGADASCFFFSLIETAKVNGLNPERYLEYILTYGPSTPKDKYDTLLPWNVDMSVIDTAIASRANATPDPERKEPYIFTGFSR